MQQIIDYRNSRYQGFTNSNKQRQGPGILVDDDLSFYISHWKNGQLSGKTMIYFTHGKYVYGQWANNQPHGLNVFRMGDTVLLAYFQNGVIKGRTLVLFERFNCISVVENITGGHCVVVEKGQLDNNSNDTLHKFIALLQVNIPDYYLSLIKYITNFISDKIKVIPLKNKNSYLGNQQGLGIIFNSNNGVLSVGMHQNQKIHQFGGVYGEQYNEEGNFLQEQVIRYKKQRPMKQIYTIYKKMHKTSLSFQNLYFQSKIKVIDQIQANLRSKFSQIVQSMHDQTITLADLNDSLDYQPIKYEPIKEISRKKQFKTIDQSPFLKKQSLKINNQEERRRNQNPIIHQKQTQRLERQSKSQIKVKKQQSQNQPTLKYKVEPKQPKSPLINKINKINNLRIQQNTLYQEPINQLKMIRSKSKLITPISNENNKSQNKVYRMLDKSQDKKMIKENQPYKRVIEDQIKKNNKQATPQNTSPYRLQSKYQNLNDRRQRILKEFQNLKHTQQIPPSKNIQQSPYVKQKLGKYNSKQNQQTSRVYIPISLVNTPKKPTEIQAPVRKNSVYTKVLNQNELNIRNDTYLSPRKGSEEQNTKRNAEQSTKRNIEQSKTPTRTKKYQYYFD